uniref:Major facilitator superfamily (MFS) profile domain-containing protein n=1 Tax=Haptolina brevifila TaxID=156173 RepID=A0A7S2G131_9EUKA|mmetsp:Transcript_24486/g.49086  ORF Transcript_24486/g.49086 Transcript_24486/m.49086 type:complete len:129 (+) Transcript_24486:37-423(+)
MPLRVRGKAVGLCTFVNWGPANLTSAFLTPWLLQRSVLGAGGTLLLFGAAALAAVPFALLFLPETRGLPLEQVAPMFTFRGWDGLRCFVMGNLAHGGGARHRPGPHTQAPATGLATQDGSRMQTWTRA